MVGYTFQLPPRRYDGKLIMRLHLCHTRASVERYSWYVCMSSRVKSEWWICPRVVCQAAKRRARKTPTVWPQISLRFHPRWGRGYRSIFYRLPTAGNNERPQVSLSYELSILDSEINIKDQHEIVRYAGKGLLACRSNSINDVGADNRRFPHLPTPRRTMRGTSLA